MKSLKLLFGLLFISMILSWKTDRSHCKNSVYILSQVNKVYDADQRWSGSAIHIHIQEPRIGNPARYTKLRMDHAADYFEMERQKDIGTIKRIITPKKESKISVNGQIDLSPEIQEKYALNLQRTQRSRNFYTIMYGLPMSINDTFWKTIEPAQKAHFEGQEVYRINIELKEEMISKHWTLITSVATNKLLAIEFNHPEDPENAGEFIKFHEEYEFDGIKIPRVRNWYAQGTNEYLGTDVIVKDLE